MPNQVREQIVQRIRKDSIGPEGEREVIRDRPSDRYVTGILFPQDAVIGAEEDDQLGFGADGDDEDQATEGAGATLASAIRPATAGLSFALNAGDSRPAADFCVSCGTYEALYVDEDGNRIDGTGAREFERWERSPHEIRLQAVPLETGRIELDGQGVPGMCLFLQVGRVGGATTVTAVLINKNQSGETRRENEERSFFQVALRVEAVEGSFLMPRPGAEAAADDDSKSTALIYREVQEYAVGHTCSATWDRSPEVSWLSTEWMPESIVPAVSDKGDAVFEELQSRGEGNALSTSWLATAAGPVLTEGLAALVDTYRQWLNVEEGRIGGLPQPFRDQAGVHISRCRSAADRMAGAVELIERDSQVRTAFQLANRAIQIQRRWATGDDDLVWRPFQLAFQLLSLASTSERGHPERNVMDLLWFPTGGGKTEAYLGLTAFLLLIRRLRRSENDDGTGTAAIMRYTLRLLTIQQFQRAARTVMACEYLRRKGAAGEDGVPNLGEIPFSIGLWVGGGATPNTRRLATQARGGSGATAKQLKDCPCCGNRLDWNITLQECRPYCRSDNCALGQQEPGLPIWTVDEDIYAVAPSLVIGTSDKFAQIVRNPSTRVFFGAGRNNHPPDLIIQDELHLISGPLGTMAALYETAIDELSSREAVRPKVIGSTATIRRAPEQIRALFNRDTCQFPPPVIDARNSGFAVYDDDKPGRLYLGLTSAGRSPKYALQAVAATVLQAAAMRALSDSEKDPYWTLVGYFNSLRELGGSLVLMQDDVPVSMRMFAARNEEPVRPIVEPVELTSRVTSDEIPDILQDLERQAGETGCYDVLLASNMISVGIDIPRLGLMLVNGQPKTLSEYIQATSRVGRGDVAGIVLTLYYNSRARDRSRYETFSSWHGALYQAVEATSVTPFASRAQDKALHAVLVALVRHRVATMQTSPQLSEASRQAANSLASSIEQRAAAVDSAEQEAVREKLSGLLDEWQQSTNLQEYWDDYRNLRSLMMSAEQYAASVAGGGGAGGGAGGARRALWPTPNSLRDVEPSSPFVLVERLRQQGDGNA